MRRSQRIQHLLVVSFLCSIPTGCFKDESQLVEQSLLSADKLAKDYGTVDAGEIIEVDFELSNTTGSPITVSRVISSCGCTVPELDSNVLAPNSHVPLKVVVDTSGKKGRSIGEITLGYKSVGSDVEQFLRLRVIGRVRYALNVTPTTLFFSDLVYDQEYTKNIEISSEIYSSMSIRNVQSSMENVSVSWNKLAEGHFRVDVSLKPEYPQNTGSGSLIFRLSDHPTHSYSASIRAEFQAPFRVTPSSVMLSPETPTKEILVKPLDEIDTENLQFDLDMDGVSLKRLRTVPSEAVLEITMADVKSSGYRSGSLFLSNRSEAIYAPQEVLIVWGSPRRKLSKE